MVYLGGVALEAVQHEVQMVPVQPQQAAAHQGPGLLVARYPEKLFCSRIPQACSEFKRL